MNASQSIGRLTGKVALVTGSSRGIGEAIARQLAAEGASLVINARSSQGAGKEVAQSMPSATFVQGDVADDADAIVAASVEAFGRLDILVNNAGHIEASFEGFEAQTLDVWKRVLAVNLLAPWQLTLAALPELRRSGAGVIINVSSIIGTRVWGPSIPYAVSKAALNHLTRYMAVEFGPEVRVNAVAPGFVDTEWTSDLTNPSRAAIRDSVVSEAPLRRTATPQDVANAVSGLIQASYVSGQILGVDGGYPLVR